MSNMLSEIRENTDGCAEHYICATKLYLIPMLLHIFSVIIDRGITSPGHGKYFIDGINVIDKMFILQLM